ncbi:MAG TPA: UDP-N-acetylmuramate dehydrogenase [Kofleriaceae bacterium]|nr:UDP-N-acetylmuramate dehydrogenase [Kofleriaceae bacterium]
MDEILIGDEIEEAAGEEIAAAPAPNARSILSAADRDELRAIAGEHVRFDEPMRRHTTLKMGGPADALAQPGSIDELAKICRWAAARGVGVTVVGGGSNLLVRDGGVRGLVLGTRNLRDLRLLDPTTIRVEAGVSTGKVLSLATKNDLGGVEFLGGVPGSVGGGMIMNAGTYVGEFKDVTTFVESVRISDGAVVRRTNAECGFRYRHSDLPASEVVVAAELQLKPRPRAEIQADVASLRKRRSEREPKKVASAGSIFKNPSGDFAGRLIEAAGLKGTRVGDAICSPVHANWLVNTGAARASDLLALIELVRARVQEAHGIMLELEVKVIGDD